MADDVKVSLLEICEEYLSKHPLSAEVWLLILHVIIL